MNDIQKKTYIDKDETDSMENKQMKNKQIVCTYNNETSKDYKQYTILLMITLLPIVLIKMNDNAFSTIYHIINVNITRFAGIASV